MTIDKQQLDKAADIAAREYSKAHLYASMFYAHFDVAQETMLKVGVYDKELLGSHRKIEMAYDNYIRSINKLLPGTKEATNLGRDYDRFHKVFNALLDGDVDTLFPWLREYLGINAREWNRLMKDNEQITD